MGAWAQPLAFALLVLACIVLGVMSADSRPEFNGVRSSSRERWFPHSRRD